MSDGKTLRHSRDKQWEPEGETDHEAAQAVEAHVELHFGKIATVWHEIASDLVHIDVHVVPPTDDRPFHTLVTSGMSDLPMAVPPGAQASEFAELMLCLPPRWPMADYATSADESSWPVGLLRTVARLPHIYRTWIAAWHSVPNGDPAEPYAADSPFVGALVTPMVLCGPEADTITTASGKEISLLALIPLHRAELELKVSQGFQALLEGFQRDGVSELLDPTRPSTV
jgi:hypothetical protein